MFLAQDRENVEEAFPGDIIGIHNHGTIRIGDSFTEKEISDLSAFHFAPEHFRKVRIDNALKAKQLEKGLQQLTEEGAVQLFRPLNRNDYLLGAVGILQFDVILARLKNEYGVESHLEPANFLTARWVVTQDAEALKRFEKQFLDSLTRDSQGILFIFQPMHGDLSEQQKIGQKSSFFKRWKLTDHGKRANNLLCT